MTLNSTYPQRSYNARFAQVSKPTSQVDNARAQSMVVQKTPIVNWGRDAVHKRSSVAISVGKQSHRVSKFHCEFHVSWLTSTIFHHKNNYAKIIMKSMCSIVVMLELIS